MEKRIKRRIGALVVVGMFVAMLYLPGVISQDGETKVETDGNYRIDIDNNDDEDDRIFSVSHDDGEELFRVQENGNVGIGTTSPGAILDVAGAIKSSGPITGTILFHNTNEAGTPIGDGFRIRHDGDFFESQIDALIIEKTDGNNADPDNGHSGIAFTNTGNDGEVETAMVIKGDGKVGIGTKYPHNKLHVFADSAGAVSSYPNSFLTIENSGSAYMQFLSPNTGFQGILFGDPESNAAGYIEYCHGENSMRFNVNGDRAIFIDNQRRVGIGTTSPADELDVVGTVRMTGFKMPMNPVNGYVLTCTDAATGEGTWAPAQIGIDGSGTTNYIPKFTDATTLGNSVIYENNGQIGIGTNAPVTTLDVNGGLAANTITVFPPEYTVRTWSNDFTILANTGPGPITINLPPVATASGRILVIKKIDLGQGAVTILPSPGETIDGMPILTWNTPYTSYMIQADMTNPYGPQWYII